MRKVNFPLALLLGALLMPLAWQCKNITKPAIGEMVTGMEISPARVPMFTGELNEKCFTVVLGFSEMEKSPVLERVTVLFTEGSELSGVDSVRVNYSDGEKSLEFASSGPVPGKVVFDGNLELSGSSHFLHFDFLIKPEADLLTRFGIGEIQLSFKNYKALTVKPGESYVHRAALVLRAAGQDSCDTYRIPGLVTTGKGTLIAVYDNRYNNSKDLQEDVDIGMSRSTDGGQSWEPMKVIMDMGEYGGRPHRLNGIGDPCVLYDHINQTLWVAALWMSGSAPDQMLWWASKPGMRPEETGQFVLVKSTDDGLTWSEPVNITSQIKDPSWQLLLQGPGRGITTSDGTLVFPAQFKADIGEKSLDGGPYTCHSTVVTSTDGGNSWQIGTGAKSNTTEAQVVELADGRLMLNMRDDRNRRDKGETNGRAVATSADLGKTWEVHPSSNGALPEPNCMASIISADMTIDGVKKQVLFFSNPNNKEARTHMTIKASLDDGLTWPVEYQVELNAAGGYGYSCMTMVDENNVGILYEGTKELFFQKIPVKDIVKGLLDY